ncbi:serine/threonine-protein kinase Nek5-like [Watersipora subatra]|uniref:serine/threonine-protein kinase Nek5-like n=1 Tax=Watersipora subatra TaxID=2589382 RepID=UPI00355BE0E3
MEAYSDLSFIGEGSYGKAYLCERKVDKAKLILKTVDLTGLDDREKANAQREVQVLQKLSHPCIIQYEDSFKDGELICIVMEYCELGDLCKRVMEGNKLSDVEVWNYFIQICKGLQYIHGCKVVHRDLTAKNIFISKDNTLRLGDFGLAKAYTGPTMKSRAQIGAIEFNAPEMLEDMPFTDKCDVWAAGCILYFMITAQLPFQGSILALSRAIGAANYKPIPASVDEELRDTVAWLLTPDPKERPNITQVLSSNRLKKRLEPSIRLAQTYGYSVKSGSLQDRNGSRCNPNHYQNIQDNRLRFSGIMEILTDDLFQRMSGMGLKKLPVPLGPRVDPTFDNPGTVIFATPDWKRCRNLLVLIHGSGQVKVGQWAQKRMVYSNSLESGTQLPYIRKALANDYELLILNCNDYKPVTGCDSFINHGLYVWKNYVMKSEAQKIAIKSHSHGGSIVEAVYNNFESHFRKKVYANAFTGDASVQVPLNDFTRAITRSWIKSSEPLGMALHTGSELSCISAGTTEHSYTPHNAFPKVFEFLAERFSDASPGNM